MVHPKYNFFTYEFDLALVQLDSSLEFAPHIAPICLPATESLLIGRNATGKNLKSVTKVSIKYIRKLVHKIFR